MVGKEGLYCQRIAQSVLLDGLYPVIGLTDGPMKGLHGTAYDRHSRHQDQDQQGVQQEETPVPQQQNQGGPNHPHHQGQQDGRDVHDGIDCDGYIIVQMILKLSQRMLAQRGILGVEQSLEKMTADTGLHLKNGALADVEGQGPQCGLQEEEKTVDPDAGEKEGAVSRYHAVDQETEDQREQQGVCCLPQCKKGQKEYTAAAGAAAAPDPTNGTLLRGPLFHDGSPFPDSLCSRPLIRISTYRTGKSMGHTRA